MLVDTHTHLNFKAFKKDWLEVVERAIKNGVSKMIVVGTDIKSSERAVEMAQEHSALYTTVGVHPHHVRALREITNYKLQISNIEKQLRKLLKKPKVIAVGEVGLDYFQYKNSIYPSSMLKINDEIKELQRQLITAQIKTAQEFNKPLILHSREAGEEVLDLVMEVSKKLNWKARGVFHCFEGNKEYLKKILDAGFYISFTGNISYSDDKAQLSKEVPLEKLLLETDSPLLTPVPLRGKRNEPLNVKIIAEKHAKLRSVQLNEVSRQTTENAKRLFHI